MTMFFLIIFIHIEIYISIGEEIKRKDRSAVFQSDVSFHIVFASETLLALRTLVDLGPVYGGMVPPVGHLFAADPARVHGRGIRQSLEHAAVIARG